MKTIDNVRWLELERYHARSRRIGVAAGVVVALTLWAMIIAKVLVLQ